MIADLRWKTRGRMSDRFELPLAERHRFAWDIHKDADTILHNRMNALLVVQALMFGAYFVATDFDATRGDRTTYQIIIFGASILINLGYWRLSQRIIAGILRLKEKYLLRYEPYRTYFLAIDARRRLSLKPPVWLRDETGRPMFPDKAFPDTSPHQRRLTRRPFSPTPSYILPQALPWVFNAIWVGLLLIAVRQT